MTEIIRVPQKVVAVRFLDSLEGSLERFGVGYSEEAPFHEAAENWWVPDGGSQTGAFYTGHLDPVNGQLVLGLPEIAQVYGQQLGEVGRALRQIARNAGRPSGEWRKGDILGGIYELTEADIGSAGEHSRIGGSQVVVGTVNHPSTPGQLLTHVVEKRDLLKPGDKVVCVQHTGDGFSEYELLHEELGDLVVVDGMRFGAYTLFGDPTPVLRVEYALKD
tara:strand:+ start:42 stop:698 length:657 start_codon:yes stop_codon:yes gene_type:complete